MREIEPRPCGSAEGVGWPGAGLDPYPARETKCQALMLDHLRHFFKNTDRNRPDFLFGLKAKVPKVSNQAAFRMVPASTGR